MKINYRESSSRTLFARKRARGALDDNNHAETEIRTIHGINDETKTYVKGSYREFANSYRSAQDGPTNKLR
jgi:hypothetical protein